MWWQCNKINKMWFSINSLCVEIQENFVIQHIHLKLFFNQIWDVVHKLTIQRLEMHFLHHKLVYFKFCFVLPKIYIRMHPLRILDEVSELLILESWKNSKPFQFLLCPLDTYTKSSPLFRAAWFVFTLTLEQEKWRKSCDLVF